MSRPFHHHAAPLARAPLLGHHRMPHARHHGDHGCGVRYFRRPNRVRDVLAVEQDEQLPVSRHEIDARRAGQR